MIDADYINSVIGKPWVNRAEGPDAFDCWGLVLDSFRKIDGIELPQISGYCDESCKTEDAADEALIGGKYEKCGAQDGAIMTVISRGRITHVGRCLCGGILHTAKGMGAKFEKVRDVEFKNQKIEYYRYANNNSL